MSEAITLAVNDGVVLEGVISDVRATSSSVAPMRWWLLPTA
jgi:hypothetical protein